MTTGNLFDGDLSSVPNREEPAVLILSKSLKQIATKMQLLGESPCGRCCLYRKRDYVPVEASYRLSYRILFWAFSFIRVVLWDSATWPHRS